MKNINPTLINNPYILNCILLAGLLMGNDAYAQEKKADIELIVVGTRTESDIETIPADISIITSEQIINSGATTLVELLRGVSSIQIGDNSTNITLSLRGFSAEQAGSNTLILVNGRRLNYSDLAAPQLATIPLDEIIRIEILNSSAAVVYGDQAVAGVINIITRDQLEAFTELNWSAGSNHLSNIGFAKAIKLGENWGLLLSAKNNHTDNYREHNEEELQQQQLNINYETETIAITFAIDLADQDIETPGALLEADLLQDRESSRTEFANDFLEIQSHNYRISTHFNLSNKWKFEADLQKNTEDNRSLTSFINFANSTISETNRELVSFNPRITTKFKTEHGVASFTTGIDLINSDYSFSLLNRSNQQKLTSGYFFILMPVSKNLQLSGGARYATTEDKLFDGFTYPNGIKLNNNASAFNFGVNYQLQNDLRLFSRIEKNYRFAKVDEQAYTSPDVIGLDPQLGISVDAGVESVNIHREWKLSLYQLKIKDEIIFDPNEAPPAGAPFQGANLNTDKSTRKGIKFELMQEISNKIQSQLNLVWVDARFTSGLNNNNKIPGVAKYSTRLKLKYDINPSTNFSLEHIYTGKRKQEGDTGGFSPKLKSYSLLNLTFFHNFSGTLDNYQLSARLNNLLDKEYIGFAQFDGFYPAAGITAKLMLRYHFN